MAAAVGSGVGRAQVVGLYRTILKTARTWIANVPTETSSERVYIMKEAKELFRRNKYVKDPEEIRQCVKEAETRLEMGKHYRNPYPRPPNAAPNLLPLGKRPLMAQERLRQQSKPIYIRSYDS
eukprot:Opistho-2@52143